MSARFTKLEAVDLTDEEEEGAEGESDGGYHVSLVLGGDGEKRRVKRKGNCSRIRSWWWVLIALIAFSVSIFVSLMIAELTSEPPQTNKDTANNVVHRGKMAASYGWLLCMCTVEPLIKDTLNKGHLCIKNTF